MADRLPLLIANEISLTTGVILRGTVATFIVCSRHLQLESLSPVLDSLVDTVKESALFLETLCHGKLPRMTDSQYEKLAAPLYGHIITHFAEPILRHTQGYAACLNMLDIPGLVKDIQSRSESWKMKFASTITDATPLTDGDKALKLLEGILPRTFDCNVDNTAYCISRMFSMLKTQANTLILGLQRFDGRATAEMITALSFISQNSTLFTETRVLSSMISVFLHKQDDRAQNGRPDREIFIQNLRDIKNRARKMCRYFEAIEYLLKKLQRYPFRHIVLKGLTCELHQGNPIWTDNKHYYKKGYVYTRMIPLNI
jgi:hypothetical protein